MPPHHPTLSTRPGVLARLLAALVLALAGCSSSASPATTTRLPTSGATSTTRPGSGAIPAPVIPIRPPSAEVAARVAALKGRLAIGQGNRLAVTHPDGSNLAYVEPDPATVAAQPTWSRDGSHLAWSRTAAGNNELTVLNLATDQRVTSGLAGNPAFYLQWSPDGGSLAFLRNDATLAGVELGLLNPGQPPVRMGVASPLFISWAPGPPVLAAHVSQQQVLYLPSPLAPAATPPLQPASVLQPSGPFTTPAWIDAATLLVATPDGLATLDVAGNHQTVVVPADGPISFVLSPDRKRVAFHQLGQQGRSVSPVVLTPTTTAPGSGSGSGDGGDGGDGGGGAPADDGGLQILELATGALTTVTDTGPLAFEWAPDSRHLAWLDPGVSAARPRVHWSFWDGQANSSSVAYVMSPAVHDHYLPFFEQYAQSVTGWSPDSSAFAFAGHPDGAGDGDGVWVQLVDVPGASPLQVATGDVVAWSP